MRGSIHHPISGRFRMSSTRPGRRSTRIGMHSSRTRSAAERERGWASRDQGLAKLLGHVRFDLGSTVGSRLLVSAISTRRAEQRSKVTQRRDAQAVDFPCRRSSRARRQEEARRLDSWFARRWHAALQFRGVCDTRRPARLAAGRSPSTHWSPSVATGRVLSPQSSRETHVRGGLARTARSGIPGVSATFETPRCRITML